MITRKMNHRVTFFREVGGQNEGGEVISPIQQPEGTIFNIPITDGRISAGQYLIILEAGGDVMVQKMIIVR